MASRDALLLRQRRPGLVDAEADVVERRQPRQQARRLEHDAAIEAGAVHDRAVDGDVAGVGGVEAGGDAERRRLAAAGVPDEADELAGLERQREVLHDDEAAGAVRRRVGLGEPFEGQAGPHASPSSAAIRSTAAAMVGATGAGTRAAGRTAARGAEQVVDHRLADALEVGGPVERRVAARPLELDRDRRAERRAAGRPTAGRCGRRAGSPRRRRW